MVCREIYQFILVYVMLGLVSKFKSRKNSMNISELTKLLEQEINSKMEEMTTLGKEAKQLSMQAEKLYLKMAALWMNELKPAENLIRSQNPQLCELFDSLEKIYTQPEKKKDDLDLGMTLSSYDQK